MIVRKQPDGEVMLLTQTDHSRLAGFLASHWGNATFAPLQPYESVTRAATFHDFGWLRYETNPEINPETGEPFTFQNLPFDPQQLDAYQWCVDWLGGVDRYAALLVGLHRVGLWRSRFDTITHPVWRYGNIELPAEIEAYIARTRPTLDQERAAIGGDTLWTNYRLLQVWDLLGLYFTCTDPYEHAVEPVPTEYDGESLSGVRMTLHPLSDRRVVMEPYPFDARPLTLHIPFRRMAQASFPDVATFRRAYFQTLPEMLTYTVE
jgi:Protein of unknown function (DUF3891)